MIRNAIGSLIALIGAAAAVWSTFLPWYGGRDGKDFGLSDLFTSAGVSGSQPALLLGLFLPMLAAAVLTVIGLLLRSRLLVALAALLTLAFVVLWMIRQGVAEGSLTFGGGGGLDWGVGIAFAGAAVLLLGAVFMAGRRPRGRGRHRGAPDTRLRRRSTAPAAGAAAGAGAGAAGAVAAGRGERPGAGTEEPRPDDGRPAAAGTGAGASTSPAAGHGDRDGTGADGTRPVPTAAADSGRAPAGAGAGPTPGEQAPRPVAGGEAKGPGTREGAEPAEPRSSGAPGAAAAAGGAGAAGATAAGRGDRREADTAGTGPGGEAGTTEPGAGEAGTPPATRPMPHTQPVSGSGEGAGTGRRAGAASGDTATGAGAGAGAGADDGGPANRPAGAGLGDFPRDERADWSRDREGTRPAATGASPDETAQRPPAGAGAARRTAPHGDMRAEKGPDAMRPEEARSGTAPQAPEAERKEPLTQRLLHRLQHRGHHGPRGGDHRDAA